MIYLVPGLGNDHRIFQNLDLKDSAFEYIDWIEPKLDESIQSYAQRLFSKIQSTEEEIIIIGHSFGAMVAQVFAKTNRVSKIIIISSIRFRSELPLYFRIVDLLNLYPLFRKSYVHFSLQFFSHVYGFRTPEQGKLFESMVNKHSNHYLQWSLKSVARWKDVGDISSELIRFHGERDFTFPLRKVKQPFSLLEGASHFMIITESERLNPLIREALKY